MRGSSNKGKDILRSAMNTGRPAPTRKTVSGGGSVDHNPTPAFSQKRDTGPSAMSEKFTEGMMPSKGGSSKIATPFIQGLGHKYNGRGKGK